MNFGGSVRVNPMGIVVLGLILFLFLYINYPGGSSPTVTSSNGSTVSMKALLAVSIEAAKRGGREVKRIREQADIGEKSKGKTKEGANNPVTDGDMLSHRAMYYSLLKAFPKISVISEEDDDLKDVDIESVTLPSYHDAEVDRIIQNDMKIPIDEVDIWIDPLDATVEYTENLLEYVTTMVCVAVRGKPVMGVIHKPFEGLTAWGWAGPNHVSQIVAEDVENNHPNEHKDLGKSRIIVSRSHKGDVEKVALDAFGELAKVTPAGGAGFKSWEVIKGTQDAYVHVTLIKKWDICAGNAILNALGGKLTTLNGQEIDYSGRPEKHEKNEGGVLATMHDHSAYVDKLKDTLVSTAEKKKP